jgi:hypothetical protein
MRCARRIALAGSLAVQVAALLMTAMPLHAQSPRSGQRLLLVNQTVTAPTAGLVSTTSARVGTLAFGPRGLGSDQAFETVHNPTSIAQVAIRDFGVGLTQGQLLAQAAADFSAQSAAVAGALGTALRARGLSQATFVFDQQVIVAGAARPRQLVWTLSVDSSGRSSFASPQLFDSQPTVLYAPIRTVATCAGSCSTCDCSRWAR